MKRQTPSGTYVYEIKTKYHLFKKRSNSNYNYIVIAENKEKILDRKFSNSMDNAIRYRNNFVNIFNVRYKDEYPGTEVTIFNTSAKIQ